MHLASLIKKCEDETLPRGDILRSDNPKDFLQWENLPTAGERCFWKDRLHLVFVRGQNVVALNATSYSQEELQQRYDLLRSLAPAFDQRLGQK